MKKLILLGSIVAAILGLFSFESAAIPLADTLPVRGFAIAAPKKGQVDRFVGFMDTELRRRGVNTLVLRVDFDYAYESHPELRGANPLSKEDIQRLVEAGKRNGIQLIPQVNLLGHQSWAGTIGNLLKVYPEFDETPHVQMPAEYKWPNDDGLYCKSYCPLHPEVHGVVFALVDELCDAFEADAFHAGMDEVFYIGDDKCPRCGGRDKAALFAGEVTKIRNHLAGRNRKLWIWGDRLIDGKETGIGMWEASMNNTHRAIDMIPKDVVIADWHYVRPVQTPVYFAMKGFDVVSCSWDQPEVGVKHVEDMLTFRAHNTNAMKDRFKGVMLTVWSSAEQFLDGFDKYKAEQGKELSEAEAKNPWVTFVKMFERLEALAN
ncbi:MAG: family 20 glycosylhydrolase [Lunatimonas sp.]|uniref:family 20 glycosylhydrolase n=1 Tax=Lunatimonas sp. TaxID=2060141 RepID=UPI00263A5072|nr:family 20 glycosylhydrolase [Lunatimonas sp.]MCC5939193.1 family 20 glycosylhydrolase [Lunatimonas sp.]